MATATAERAAVKKLKEADCVVTIQVEVPAAKVQETTHNVWLQLQGQVRLPGFRPGKAPLELVQRQFAGAAREKILDRLIQKAVPQAIEDLGLKAVAVPGVHDVSMEAAKPLIFQLDVEIAPKFELKGYKKLPVTRKAYPATDEEVGKRLEELREGNARLERTLKEVVEKDHYVVVDYEGFLDGKQLKGAKGVDELVDMSSHQTIEGLTDGLLGAKRGESRELPVKIDGKPASFKVAVKEIKTKVLPGADDEFAKDLGFQTLLELRVKLREMIDAEGKRRTEEELRGQLEEGLLKANRFPAPPSLVEHRLERLLDGLKSQLLGPDREWPEGELPKLREKLRPKAEGEVRLSYILRAVAAAEKIEAAEDDVKTELARSVEAAETDERKADVRRFFQERADEVASLVVERKVMAFLKENAAVKEA